jgi:TRAP-type C4-dicarboxylate transport system permease small subunit
MRLMEAKQALLGGVRFFLKVVHWIGYVSLAGMILLTNVNVFGRYILRRPLLGEFDMVELGMAVFGGIAMFIAAMERHHVSVDVVLVHFSGRTQRIFGRIASLMGFATWGLLAYLTFLDGLDSLKSGSYSATLRVPHGPFELVLAFCIFLFSLALLVQLFRPEESAKKDVEDLQL